MKMLYVIVLLFLLSNAGFCQSFTNAVNSGERHSIKSEVLKEERSFQVFLPKSYAYSKGANFPVLYLMDGDYNFHYVTGMVEMLIESGTIPEMIVVGISDKGSLKYRQYCRPTTSSENTGSANIFMDFIEQELKPFIQKNYKASGFEIISGHSMGGLFTTNYFLERPKSFDVFIAIDPSLWYDGNEITGRANTLLEKCSKLESKLYISLANTKGMGILEFVGVLDKYFPYQEKWDFQHYKNENHGSVGIPTMKHALESVFEDWPMTRAKFEQFENLQELVDYYVKLSESFDTKFLLASSMLANATYEVLENEAAIQQLEQAINEHFPASVETFNVQHALLLIGKGKLEKAKNILETNLLKFPDSFQTYDALSQVYLKLEDDEHARTLSLQAIKIAKELHVRKWMLNEIISNYEKAL